MWLVKLLVTVNGNLAVSNIRKLECSSFDFHSIAYGYGTFKEKYILRNTILDLRSRGINITRTAQRLGVSRDTVKHLESLSSEDLILECQNSKNRRYKLHRYEQAVVSLLLRFPSISSSRVHDHLKEHYPDFPRVCEKTVHNYVQFIRKKHHILSAR